MSVLRSSGISGADIPLLSGRVHVVCGSMLSIDTLKEQNPDPAAGRSPLFRITAMIGLVMSSLTVAGEPKLPPPGAPPGARHYPLFSPPSWLGPGPATGNWRGVGPDLNWSYYGVPSGPYLGVGGFPFGPSGFSRNGDYWSNGLSLYGPPVPTYGPTAGALNGNDNSRLYFLRPAYAVGFPIIGYGWVGRYAASPRPSPNVSAWPTPPKPVIPQPLPGPGLLDYPGSSPRLQPPLPEEGHPSIPKIPEDSTPLPAPKETATMEAKARFRLSIRVPTEDAEIWVDKTYQTQQKGIERSFETPPLEPGHYRYEVIARWTEQGQPRAESREVFAQPGQTLRIDFTRPADIAGRQAR